MTLLLAIWIALSSYAIAPGKNDRFTLEVEKTGLMKGKHHTFVFPKYSGAVQFDAAAPERSSVKFTLDAAGMTCQDDWVKDSDREKILAWGLDRMIEVKQYPTISFVSDKVARGEGNHYSVTGRLTMRGVTRPATIDVTEAEAGSSLKLDGKSIVNMKEFGMKPPTAGLGTVGTKPEMTVLFMLTVTPSK